MSTIFETITIDKRRLEEIRDDLRSALDAYENDDGSGDAGDAGERLYQSIYWAVKALENELN